MAKEPETESAWRLRTDLAWAYALLWVATAGRGGEPKRDVHLYLADRYGRLSDYYARRGAAGNAKRFNAKSEWHYRAAGPDEPPRAVAMAMPIPDHTNVANAVGYEPTEGSDDVA